MITPLAAKTIMMMINPPLSPSISPVTQPFIRILKQAKPKSNHAELNRLSLRGGHNTYFIMPIHALSVHLYILIRHNGGPAMAAGNLRNPNSAKEKEYNI